MANRTDIVSRLRKELPEIQTPAMAGDRLKDIIEEAFDLPNSVFDKEGDANGVLDAIHAHYADLIQSQQALIEEMREALRQSYVDVAIARGAGVTEAQITADVRASSDLRYISKALSQKDQIDG